MLLEVRDQHVAVAVLAWLAVANKRSTTKLFHFFRQSGVTLQVPLVPINGLIATIFGNTERVAPLRGWKAALTGPTTDVQVMALKAAYFIQTRPLWDGEVVRGPRLELILINLELINRILLCKLLVIGHQLRVGDGPPCQPDCQTCLHTCRMVSLAIDFLPAW